MPTDIHWRTSHVMYRSRPPANRRAARWAWDRFAEDCPVEQVRLLDGHWGAIRPGGGLVDEIGAAVVTRAVREGRAPRASI